MTESICPGLLLDEEQSGVFELTFDRPERRNALTEEMMQGLGTVVDVVNQRADAVALIVRGNGGAFCAGADMGVVAARSKGDATHRWPELMGREAELLAHCEVPTISVVTGPAVGLGMGLAIGCDICIVEPQGYFAEAHLALGLTPTAMCWWLPRMAGLQRAADIVLTGRRVYGDEALAIGLAARLAPVDHGREAALAVAAEIAQKPRVMTRFAKMALRMAQDEQTMSLVRLFGGLANRLHRGIAAQNGPPSAHEQIPDPLT
jgi:2-(1,2-epoxy-1,2-dihydrophenyl)acetyl-CoA isomerase